MRRDSRHNEIRSHIDKYQRTGVTGFFCTHRYFENTPLFVIHGHTQTDSVVTTTGAFSKGKRYARLQGKIECKCQSRALKSRREATTLRGA